MHVGQMTLRGTDYVLLGLVFTSIRPPADFARVSVRTFPMFISLTKSIVTKADKLTPVRFE